MHIQVTRWLVLKINLNISACIYINIKIVSDTNFHFSLYFPSTPSIEEIDFIIGLFRRKKYLEYIFFTRK